MIASTVHTNCTVACSELPRSDNSLSSNIRFKRYCVTGEREAFQLVACSCNDDGMLRTLRMLDFSKVRKGKDRSRRHSDPETNALNIESRPGIYERNINGSKQTGGKHSSLCAYSHACEHIDQSSEQ